MINRRSMLLSLTGLAFTPPAANAGFLERLKARRESISIPYDLITIDYGPSLLDIYAPKKAVNLPVYVHVHGGGWTGGSRKNIQAKPKWFVNQGFVFVSIDYRLLPEAPVSMQADDVETAYLYIRKHIAKFGGDPSRIIVGGHSAGCHLTALTGLRGGLKRVKAMVLSDVDVYDIAAVAVDPASRGLNREAFADEAQWKALSPATFIGTRTHPPIFIAYSRVKNHKETATRFAMKLRAVGTKVVLYDGSQYSHFSINRSFGTQSDGITGATLKFLQDVLA